MNSNNREPKIAQLRELIEQLELPKNGKGAAEVFRVDRDAAAEVVETSYPRKAALSTQNKKLQLDGVAALTTAEPFEDEAAAACVREAKTFKGRRYGKGGKSAAVKPEEPKERFTTANQVYDYALNLLSFRDYSKAEMLDKLIKKGAAEEFAKEAIVKLLDYNFLNEERYALRVYEMWLNKRVYGRLHLQAELKKRSIEPEAAAKVLEQFTVEVEEQRAAAAAEIFLQQNRKKLQELQNLQQDEVDYAGDDDWQEETGYSSLQKSKKNTKKISQWGNRWGSAQNSKAAARIAAFKKLQAAAGRFMAARGFGARYMHILLSKLHMSNDM